MQYGWALLIAHWEISRRSQFVGCFFPSISISNAWIMKYNNMSADSVRCWESGRISIFIVVRNWQSIAMHLMTHLPHSENKDALWMRKCVIYLME